MTTYDGGTGNVFAYSFRKDLDFFFVSLAIWSTGQQFT